MRFQTISDLSLKWSLCHISSSSGRSRLYKLCWGTFIQCNECVHHWIPSSLHPHILHGVLTERIQQSVPNSLLDRKNPGKQKPCSHSALDACSAEGQSSQECPRPAFLLQQNIGCQIYTRQAFLKSSHFPSVLLWFTVIGPMGAIWV